MSSPVNRVVYNIRRITGNQPEDGRIAHVRYLLCEVAPEAHRGQYAVNGLHDAFRLGLFPVVFVGVDLDFVHNGGHDFVVATVKSVIEVAPA